MGKPRTTKLPAARFAYEGLDRTLHERARLGILTSLIAHPKGLAFRDLKELCALTDGNLSRHLHVLQESKFVVISKAFAGRRPQTVCRVTAHGRKRYLEYLTVLEQVVRDAEIVAKEGASLDTARRLTII